MSNFSDSIGGRLPTFTIDNTTKFSYSNSSGMHSGFGCSEPTQVCDYTHPSWSCGTTTDEDNRRTQNNSSVSTPKTIPYIISPAFI